MIDKIYILIALVVAIIITIIMLLGDYTAVEWATTTFWAILIYLVIGLVLRNYLKTKVFVQNKNDEKIDTNEKTEDVSEEDNEENVSYINDVQDVFSDENDE